jgi:hypothetical protein
VRADRSSGEAAEEGDGAWSAVGPGRHQPDQVPGEAQAKEKQERLPLA